MDPRYQDEHVLNLWSTTTRHQHWLTIGRTVVDVQARVLGTIPRDAAERILNDGPGVDEHWPRVRSENILDLEQVTRHDVAAFLQWWRSKLGDDARWVHFGLTSSDLVDTAAGLRFVGIRDRIWQATEDLLEALGVLVRRHGRTPVLGHTHGQPAEPTSLGIRADGWFRMVSRCVGRLWMFWNGLEVAKLSGPVGTYAHNGPDLEQWVASQLGLRPAGPGHTQVVARDALAAWATATAQLVGAIGKLAVDFRLMAHRGEVSEGWPDGRVGSSAMPHKVNPVTAEKIGGMVRLAHGYASMLQPVDLWDERDISHSSVERVAVPDLLHTLLHALNSAVDLLTHAQWDTGRMRRNLADAGKLPYTAWYALEAARDGLGPEAARAEAVKWATMRDDGQLTLAPGPHHLLRHHPVFRSGNPNPPRD